MHKPNIKAAYNAKMMGFHVEDLKEADAIAKKMGITSSLGHVDIENANDMNKAFFKISKEYNVNIKKLVCRETPDNFFKNNFFCMKNKILYQIMPQNLKQNKIDFYEKLAF